jgi:hypothetical protein
MSDAHGGLLRRGRLDWPLALLLGMLCLAPAAHASLGEPYASIAADQSRMSASLKVTARTGYEVHEMTLPSGTAVREYVTGNGIVFAVAWSGPYLPDLRQTLGKYFADYSAEAQSKRGGHDHLVLNRSDLVIQSNGHMRSFAGRAYLIASVPAGVSVDELR